MKLSSSDSAAPSATEGSTRLPAVLRVFVLAALFVTLIWSIITKSYVTYLAPHDPDAALTLNPNDATALILKAERTLTAALAPKESSPVPPSTSKESQPEAGLNLGRGFAQLLRGQRGELGPAPPLPTVPSETLTTIEQLARRALIQEPLNARAVILLGYVADLRGDKARAAEFMTHAADLSRQASAAYVWLLDYQLRAQNFAAAVRYADILMRTRPSAQPVVIPILARLAEQPATAKFVQDILSTNPPWRRTFFSTLTKNVSDQRTPLSLFIALRDAGQPPTPAELKSYLDFLISTKSFDLAYYVWLQFLEPVQLSKAGMIFDGGFDFSRSQLPFDWTLKAGSGSTVELAADEADTPNTALRVEFSGTRAERLQVSQRVVLPPGSYQLTFRYRGEISGRRGVIWLVECAVGKQQRLVESPMFIGVQRTWRDATVDFTVPDTGCESQVVRLIHHARSPSEQIVSGTVWYDDVKIARFQASTP